MPPKRKGKGAKAEPPLSSEEGASKPPLRLAVFDLDFTIWRPEMYQLHGAPTLKSVDAKENEKLSAKVLQEAKTNKEGYILSDRHNTPMRVFPGAAYALKEIEKLKAAGYDIRAAVASKTDEPSWARVCMNHLVIDDEGTPLISCFGADGRLIEIAYGNKKDHLTRLHKKTKIPFAQMAFFDNESGNVRSVSNLGVRSYHCRRGMTVQDWEKAKEDFGLDVGSIIIASSGAEESS